MKISENMIVADTTPGSNWEFDKILSELTGESWETVDGGLQNKLFSPMQKIKRYINLFYFPLQLFFHRKKIKNLIAWQQYYGLMYALYCMIFHIKKCNYCLVMAFIYNERKGILGSLQYKIVKRIVNSRYLDCIVVFSKYEKNYYENLFQVPPGKIISCRLGLEDLTEGIPREKTQSYILSAGRSNRDYDFLFQALKGRDYPVKVVCDNLNRESEGNITVYKNTYYEHFFKIIADCFCVVITLKNQDISSGQLVILQAKEFGKPVIITESRAVADYIEDGIDGFIIKKEEGALRDKIKVLMEDRKLYDSMCAAARKSYEENFSMRALGVQVLKCLTKTGRKKDE